MKRITLTVSALCICLAVAAGEAAPPANPPSPMPSSSKPYLAPASEVDSAELLPPPPAAGSATQARDDEAAAHAVALRGSARWDQATADADLFSPRATGAFSCAAGFEISATATPALDRLLRRSLIDFGTATGAAKHKYMRLRPFMVDGAPSCTPGQEQWLRRDGSYPSGHSTIGYGWGLILAELVPARATALAARGRAFGESRSICNVHWKSDIEEGRIVASATFARLQADPGFEADLQAARAEIAAGHLAAPQRDCAKEAAALAAG